MQDPDKAAAASTAMFVDVTLDQPIRRGETLIETVKVRRPRAGEMRGLNLVDVANVDVLAMRKLLPRVTTPTLTEADVDNLDPADLLALGTELSGFLLQKRQRPDFLAT